MQCNKSGPGDDEGVMTVRLIRNIMSVFSILTRLFFPNANFWILLILQDVVF